MLTRDEPPPAGRTVPLIVASAFFMEQLDGSVIGTSLPQMAASFGVHAVDVGLGMTAYLVALAAGIPLSGWVADRIGARRTFCTAIAAFACISMLCGAVPTLGAFVAARIAQGAAGAMMVPVGRTVVLRSASKAELLRAISLITWPGLIAPVLGPPIGGLITTLASWRWIFFLNVPIGVVGLALAVRFIPRIATNERRPFDARGFLLVTATLVAMMFGLDVLARGAPVIEAMGLLASGAVLGLLAARHLRRSDAPFLDFTAARIPTFAAATFGGGNFVRVAIQTAPFLLPLLFQLGLGRSAFASGCLMLAYAAGNAGMKTFTSPVLRRFGFRTVLIANGLLVALSLAACGAIVRGMPDAVIGAILFASGLCRSLQYTSINTLGFVDVPRPQMSAASTLSSTLTQLASAGGIALGALLLHTIGALRGRTAPDLTDFHIAFAGSAVLAAAVALTFRSLPADAGADVAGR